MNKINPHTKNLVMVILLSVALLSACRSKEPTEDVDAIVAATLTAVASQSSPVPTESLPLPPVDMPDPAPNINHPLSKLFIVFVDLLTPFLSE